MKNIVSVLLLALGLVFGSAQTKQNKKTHHKKEQKHQNTQTHKGAKLKKDGTPDKRYKANKKLKKDGTPDRRYKDNRTQKSLIISGFFV